MYSLLTDFFNSQNDYIYFIYGLGFILVGINAYSLSRQSKYRILWKWLALFGLAHGIYEFVDLAAIYFKDNLFLSILRAVLRTTSFVFLIEIGRDSGQKRFGNIFGRWLYLPIFVLLWLALRSYGETGINVVSRYLLGVLGGISVGAVFIAMGRKEHNKGGFGLIYIILGVIFILYALTQLVVPKLGFWPANVLNVESFKHVFGFAIQVVRAGLALAAAICMYACYVYMRKNTLPFAYSIKGVFFEVMFILALSFVLIFGWFGVNRRGAQEAGQARKELGFISKAAVLGIDPDMVRQLKGNSEDLQSPAYKRLKSQMENLQGVLKDSGVQWSYILKRVNGKVVINVDSCAPEEASFDPPGTIFKFGSEIFSYFDSGGSAVLGPFYSSEGSYIYDVSPIQDSHTKEVVGIFSIRMGNAPYNRIFGLARFDAILVSFLIITILLIFFAAWQRVIEDKDAARESEEKHRRLIDNLGKEYFFYRHDASGVFTYLSKSVGTMLGYSNEEFSSHYTKFLTDNPVNNEVILHTEKSISGEVQLPYEVELFRKDGSRIALEVTEVPVFDKEKKVIAVEGIAHDISRRAKMENALVRAGREWSSTFDAMSDAVCVIDRQHVLSNANKEFFNLLGLSSGRAMGGKFDEQLQGVSVVTEVGLSLDKAIEIKGNIYREYFDAGLRKWLAVSVSPILNDSLMRSVVILRDITERKKLDKQLENAAKAWMATFDSLTDSIFILDNALRFLRVNKACANSLSVAPQELIGKPWGNFVSGERAEFVKSLHEEALRSKTTLVREFFDSVSGRYYEFTSSVLPLVDDASSGTVNVAKDISSRKEIEKEQRLAELGKLVADMAHEVNNPLMIISGNAQLSLMEDLHNEQVKSNLKIITEECQRAKNIIHRLLKFSRPSKGERKPVDINASIDLVINLLKNQFSLANVEIKSKFQNGLPVFTIDEQQMHEVFMNLLNNARDALLPKGGVIEISTYLSADRLHIDFKDNGQGMSKETMEKIFHPFFTTKEHGTGLGLPVCYGIMKAHSGDMLFKSEIGQGTTATLILPVEGKSNA